ncbi:MAG: T9SS type A sorting domain-containing protein [Saprospiraceae bacterium]|nr:T9SS type A sorting domain-containing protein [Saprospiraceae bacterium]
MIYQKLLLCLTVATAFTSAAQPTLTNDVFPLNGIEFSLAQADTTAVSPGASGADQLWDFSGLQVLSVTGPVRMVGSNSTPYAAQFPFANLAAVWAVDQDSFYRYYRKENSALSLIGLVEYGQPTLFDDPETLLSTPLAFEGAYGDYFARHNYLPDNQLQGVAQKTAVYDGWGTLKTPLGTFSNAMRVRTETVYRDTSWLFAGYSINEHVDVSYDWYVAGRPFPQVSILTSTGNTTFYFGVIPPMTVPNPPTKTVHYLSNLSTSADEPLGGAFVASSCALYPNPARETLTLEFFGVEADKPVHCLLLDEKGSVIRQHRCKTDFGSNMVPFQVSGLPPGAYFLYLTDGRLSRILPWHKF